MISRMDRSTGAQSGVVLVIVLWVLALLVMIAGGYSVTTRTETVLTARMVSTVQARALAEAGVWLAIRDLAQPDGPGRWRTDGEVRTLNFDNGLAVVLLQDESGKIDLNAADVGLIYSLLLSAMGDGNAALSLLQAILDWRDADAGKRKSGAEAEEYVAAALVYGPRNGPFTAVDELRLVLGMNEDLYRRLVPALTVYSGDSGLNAEVAVREALLGLPDMTPLLVDEYLADRTATTQEIDQRFLSSTRRRVVTILSQGEVGDSRVRLDVVVRISHNRKAPFSLMAWRESGAVQDPRTLTPALSRKRERVATR